MVSTTVAKILLHFVTAVKNTLTRPFGGESEEKIEKEAEPDSKEMVRDQQLPRAEDIVEGNTGASENIPVQGTKDIDQESLKFTNIFDPEVEKTADSNGDREVNEMQQVPDTNQVSGDAGKEDVNQDITSGADDILKVPELSLNGGTIPQSPETDKVVDSRPKDNLNVVEADKQVDNMIDSFDTSSSQFTEQKPPSTSESLEERESAADGGSENTDLSGQRAVETDSILTLTDTSASIEATTVIEAEKSIHESEEPSGVVYDGTLFPADYFDGNEVEQSSDAEIEPTSSHVLDVTSVDLAPKVEQTAKIETTDTQTVEHTSSFSIQPSERVKEHSEVLEKPTDTISVEPSVTDNVQNSNQYTMSTPVVPENTIIPSETVHQQSTATLEHSETNIRKTEQQQPFTGDNIQTKPLVMHETRLKPSTTYDFKTEDLEKYATPYKRETIKPLNQGVDVNNRYTHTDIQSSLGSESIEKISASTESEKLAESSLVYDTPGLTSSFEAEPVSLVIEKKENLTVASDIVQDKVQPSVSQDPYTTADFASRKTLSADSVSVEESQNLDEQQQAETQHSKVKLQVQAQETIPKENQQIPTQAQDGQSQELSQDAMNRETQSSEDHQEATTQQVEMVVTPVPPTFKTAVDENNNIDENNNYNVDPVQTRKIPDEKLDEEVSGATIAQRMEPHMKTLIDMVSIDNITNGA